MDDKAIEDVATAITRELIHWRDFYEAQQDTLAQENDMLFHRAATRLAEIYELRARIVELQQELAKPIPVEVQTPEHVREYVSMVLEGEYSTDELRFVVYNDTTAHDWLLP
jgi:hypothetical protein